MSPTLTNTLTKINSTLEFKNENIENIVGKFFVTYEFMRKQEIGEKVLIDVTQTLTVSYDETKVGIHKYLEFETKKITSDNKLVYQSDEPRNVFDQQGSLDIEMYNFLMNKLPPHMKALLPKMK